MQKILTAAFTIALSSLLLAQTPPPAARGGRGGRGPAAPAVPSYEVRADRTVAFRLRAPDATTSPSPAISLTDPRR